MLRIRRIPIYWGHEVFMGKRHIDTVVIHTMYAPDVAGDARYAATQLIARLKTFNVAAHYLIVRNGEVLQLVNDNDVAYHAGKSALPEDPAGGSVNLRSLGIEIANAKDDRPTDSQYASASALVRSKRAQGMLIPYIKGHDTIALPPGRKDDPWNFDWQRFFVALGDTGL